MPVVTIKDILRWYVTPSHPISFSAPGAVYRFLKGVVPLAVIEKALQSIDAYTLHREVKRPRVFNPCYAHQPRTHFHSDLIDIRLLKTANRSVAFLLLVICVFSCKLFVMPLKTRTGREVRDALAAWLLRVEDEESAFGLTPASGKLKRFFLVDSGTEYHNQEVRQLLEAYNVRLDTASPHRHKAFSAERANHTLQVF